MHILFLTDNFPPEVNAPASRTYEHCREWVKAGHRVTVITCAPNFPSGKVFKGYRNKIFSREKMEGIEVIRVWSYITANEGFLRRTLDYLSFMFSSLPASLKVQKPDVVIATSPQFFTICAGYIVSRLRGIPYILELRDLWPESIRAVGAMKESLVLHALEKLELFLYRKADAVITVTTSFKDNLIERGILSEKIHVITNGADLSRFQPISKDRYLVDSLGIRDKFVAGYIGTHGLAHALETVLDAAHQLQNQARHDIHLLFLGGGAAKKALVAYAEKLKLKNVTFIESVPKDDVVRYWSVLDVSVIHLKDTPLFSSVIPSKLFECMAMGIPVLHGVRGESANIVEEESMGYVFEPESTKCLSDHIVRLASDSELTMKLGENGLAAATKYDRKNLASAMLLVIESLFNSTKTGAK
jgi:glycosyltransferase involved in cell wall biosynthesis